MLFVHRSNATEALVATLRSVVEVPRHALWEPESIVVQGRGMERWLSLALADALGVCANFAFPFPRHFVDETMRKILRESESLESDPYQVDALQWTVFSLLDEVREPSVVAYLRNDSSGSRRVQLSRQLADAFDRYLTYRSDWILKWGSGEDTHWQAGLWRRVEGMLGPGHHAEYLRRSRNELERADAELLPERVSVFGVGSMPPVHLEFLAALGKRCDVHLFVLAPSPHFAGERRRQLDLFGSDGPALLSTLGEQARTQQLLLEELDSTTGVEAFVEPTGGTVLQVLQADLAAHRVRTEKERVAVEPDDLSVRIHRCHGVTREVEVIHDQLLDAFDRDPSLAPHDVVVMVPKIEDYAAAIEAIFGSRGEIPYRISDRSKSRTTDVLRALSSWLDAASGRLELGAVLDLLAHEVIRKRFAIDERDVEELSHAVQKAGVRWGGDASHRASFDQPSDRNGTWELALQRLWMGWSVGADCSATTVAGIAPVGAPGSEELEAIAGLTELVSMLRQSADRARGKRSVSAWAELLAELVDALFADEQSAGLVSLREQLTQIARDAEGCAEPVELAALRGELQGRLDRTGGDSGFLAGGVTFCELVPMRTIPFRVVALLGMNDGAFPRRDSRVSFDLRHVHPRLGDRSTRDDDRNLFLEAVLSARERLIITYVGRSIKDDSVLPASPVVLELLAAIEASCAGAGSTRDVIEVPHPLQAFSSSYFDRAGDARLFTYRSELAPTAPTAEPDAPRAFLARPLEREVQTSVALGDLERFFRNPVRHFLEEQLALRFSRDLDILPIREVLDPDPTLDTWSLIDAAVGSIVAGVSTEDIYTVLQQSGRFPLGSLGRIDMERIEATAMPLVDAYRGWRGEEASRRETVHLKLGGRELHGTLDEICGERLVLTTASRAGGLSELRAWIRHVLAQTAGLGHETVLVQRGLKGDGVLTVRFAAVRDARSILETLLSIYDLGQRLPLPLFRSASRVFAAAQKEGWRVAERALTTDRRPDLSDLSVSIVYPDLTAVRAGAVGEPIAGADFESLARSVYEPMLANREVIS